MGCLPGLSCLLLGMSSAWGLLWRLMLWFLKNVARNSPTCISNIEITSLEFCGFLDTYEKLGYPNYVRVLVDEAPKANSCVRSSSHDTVHDPRDSSLWAPVAANAHVHDRGTPPAGLVRQAPDHRVTRNALAPAASTPPVLTSNTARQHCMVRLNALTRHLQPQAIQARERAQIRAIKDSSWACRGLSDGRCGNLHHRKTSTPIRPRHAQPRQQHLHPHMRRARLLSR